MLTATLVIAAAAIAGDEAPPAFDATGTALEPMTKLVGYWTTPDNDNDGKPDATVKYFTTSNGSAVVEMLFPGTDHEMVTMYNLDDGELVMTHYCALGNQPRLVGEETSPGVIEFTLRDGMNMDPETDMYMGGMTLTMHDADHMTQAWRSFKGRESQGQMMFEFRRQKDEHKKGAAAR